MILELALTSVPSGLRIGISREVGHAVLLRNNYTGAYDGLQYLAFTRQQIDIQLVLIAHPESPVLVEG